MTMTTEDSKPLRPAQKPRLPRLLGGLWRLLTTPKTVTWGEIILAVALIGVMGLFLMSGIETLKDRDVARVQFETAQATYQSDLRSYDAAVSARAICLDGVARSDSNRAQWQLLADIIAALYNGNGNAVALADQIRTGPVLSAPARSVNDCPVVPPVPTPPTR